MDWTDSSLPKSILRWPKSILRWSPYIANSLVNHSHGEAIFSNILNLVSAARSIPGGTSLWPPCFFVRLTTGVPRGIETSYYAGFQQTTKDQDDFTCRQSKLVWIWFLYMLVEAVKNNLSEIWLLEPLSDEVQTRLLRTIRSLMANSGPICNKEKVIKWKMCIIWQQIINFLKTFYIKKECLFFRN